ncbi:trigger factor [Thiovibrio frasassiensis]|uniref:Trigger factor n=1 Tax=Thiovibrio frasassiensis TaxID=2984131 RepID=A0A9X4MHD9_9BACT|nr:trigger factor [Thiovibrio frasassiensis]MDG4476381.1 trigger factor [Thiovibrio frasassiensis]
MQINVEDVSALTKKMTITLPEAQVAQELESTYRKLNSEVSLKGFRKGKIPRQVLEKNYGPKVEYDVAEKLIQESYFDALEKSKIDAVVHPDIREQKFAENGTFVYIAEVDVRPQFELGEYKGLEIEQAALEVTDEEIAQELEALQKQMAPLQSVEDRAIELGHLAVVDFQGYHNGNPIKQVVGENYSVDVGSGQYGKEFEEKLLGLKKGEEASQEIDFPANFANPILASKKVEFKINVKDVKERVLPPLDDEFAKEVGEEFATLEALKGHIREKKLLAKKDAQRGDLTDKLMKALIEAHEFEIPPRLVAYEIESMIKELESNLERQGMTLEAAGFNRDALVEQYKLAAQSRVKGDFLLKKVAEKEGLKLENEDIDKGFQRISEQYNMPVSEVKKYFSSRDDLLPFMAELLNEKILSFLLDAAKMKIVPAAA